MAISTSGKGAFDLKVSHHPDATEIGGSATDAARLSDLFHDMLSEQPRWLDQQDDDQNDECNAVAILAAVGQIADDQDLDQPENDSAQNGTGNVSDPTKHRRHERFHPRQQAHER